MRFRQLDVLGYQAGALVAAEMAVARPKQIRRVVMVSVPVLNDAERDAFRRGSSAATEDGSHLLPDWKRTMESYGSGVPLEMRARAFGEKLKSGIHPTWALAAAQQYASRERLALVTQSALVLRPKDDFWEATLRARELLPKARFIDLADQGNALFEATPEVVVEVTREFLRG
jgi:pimeloyl-ACP methyl ester carboxylesterase